MDVTPTFGDSRGNSVVKVSGENFVNTSTIQCVFTYVKGESRSVRGEFVDSSTVSCITPEAIGSAEEVLVSLSISLNDGIDIANGLGYLYYKSPAIEKIMPNRGAVDGNQFIRIHGSDFPPPHGLHNDLLIEPLCRFGNSKSDYTSLDGQNLSSLVHLEGAISELKVTQGTYISESMIHCPTPNGTDLMSMDIQAITLHGSPYVEEVQVVEVAALKSQPAVQSIFVHGDGHAINVQNLRV